ncbi:glycoprotease [Legionella busanensis]|uniref:tRNA threonylcarbamoyladenosine biosynthesis protein TsaB n=1 Tax=Legionella busanensis TaxID=190655 RepID=A0A378JPR1_9GAMM|nr:tRNA (adenosine(37)-N6)-threonylcarbamoyltransferase complex dimerization subunit type 1 TsaB [Legionella busanensis]STX51940.1 glycoprotease [Legionella busanensis]
MKLLALDTSTSVATLALSNQGEIHKQSQVGQGQHAQVILSMIETLLSEAALSITQLDGIVLGRGPGSFTGLRIACSIAQGLAYPHDLPIFPVSSLATIAYEVKMNQDKQDYPVLALIDARMNQVYWAYYDKSSPTDIPEYVSAANDINIIPTEPLQLVGINFMPYFSNLPEMLRANIIKQQEVSINAATMLHLVQSQSISPIKAEEALPIYIRNQVAHPPKSG